MPYKDKNKRNENNRKRYALQKEKHREKRKANAEKIRQLSREYRKNNPERVRETSRKSYEKNLEKRKITDKIYRKKNLEQIKIKQEEYRKNNREKLRNYAKEYRKKNHQKIKKLRSDYKPIARKRNKDRYKNDINYKLKTNLRKRLYEALKLQKSIKSYKTLNLLGCSLQDVKNHLEKQFKEGMIWENWKPDGWHIDHIKPCASFDLTDPEQQKQCFNYTNLQPLWWWENLSKGDKIFWET